MNDEKLYPMVEAVQKATGRRPHLSTVLRWSQRHNRHGLRLDSLMVGGRRLTSVEAVQRYIKANTQAADRSPFAAQPGACRQNEMTVEKAVAELDRELSDK
jgi:hypothetical protein